MLQGAHRWLDSAEKLLKEFIEGYPDDFRRADGFDALGQVFERRGDVAKALEQYELAMARVREHSGMRPDAWLNYAQLIARKRLRAHYGQAKAAVEEFDSPNPFPLHIFQVNRALALIAMDERRNEDAVRFATKALAAADARATGLRYHPFLGLVGAREEGAIRELRRIAGPGRRSIGWRIWRARD